VKVSIICVGKIKEEFYRKAVAEYEKRLSRYCKLEIIEVPDEKTPDGASALLEEQIKEKEGAKILRHLREDAYIYTLEIRGKELDSEKFAHQIEKQAVGGVSHIQFVIGGSLGLAPSVSRAADEAISFSKMTFPHQLMRVILLEQIYRGYRIISGEPYHK